MVNQQLRAIVRLRFLHLYARQTFVRKARIQRFWLILVVNSVHTVLFFFVLLYVFFCLASCGRGIEKSYIQLWQLCLNVQEQCPLTVWRSVWTRGKECSRLHQLSSKISTMLQCILWGYHSFRSKLLELQQGHCFCFFCLSTLASDVTVAHCCLEKVSCPDI